MGDKDLVEKIKHIKAEILALKQAHKYGLNRTDFDFKWTQTPSPIRTSDFRLTIQFGESVKNEPYTEINMDAPNFYSRVWNQNRHRIIIAGRYTAPEYSSSGYMITAGIISAAYIESLNLERIVSE